MGFTKKKRKIFQFFQDGKEKSTPAPNTDRTSVLEGFFSFFSSAPPKKFTPLPPPIFSQRPSPSTPLSQLHLRTMYFVGSDQSRQALRYPHH